MNHQRCFTIYLPSAEPATHVAKWPGASPFDEKALIETIRAFFLAAPFVSGADPKPGAAILGEVLDSAGVPRDTLDRYAETFKNPGPLWAEHPGVGPDGWLEGDCKPFHREPISDG